MACLPDCLQTNVLRSVWVGACAQVSGAYIFYPYLGFLAPLPLVEDKKRYIQVWVEGVHTPEFPNIP